MFTSKPIIALDADGVLLDYHQAYRQAWHRAFGVLPAVKDSQAYWPIDRWEVRFLDDKKLNKFRSCFDHTYWSTIPAIPGAINACETLHNAGYELVCVSAIESSFQESRLENLRKCGFPIERVIATMANSSNGLSPKADALRKLRPVAFVDDFLPYMRGIPNQIHAALVLREPNGSPNTGSDIEALSDSQHANLAEFAIWWLQTYPVNR